jgi:acyl CoA:acetate/3-ketoacid CoA transferase alpha subunit
LPGNDVIHDFQHGKDTIKLGGFDLGHKSAQALAHLSDKALNDLLHIQTLDTNGDHVLDSVIHFDANNSVTVLGVSHLTASDFHFIV